MYQDWFEEYEKAINGDKKQKKGANNMWDEFVEYEEFQESEKRMNERIAKERELEEKFFRISHPILATLDDARIWLGKKILGI